MVPIGTAIFRDMTDTLLVVGAGFLIGFALIGGVWLALRRHK